MAIRFTSTRIVPHLDQTTPGGYDLYWGIEGQNFNPTFQVLVSDEDSAAGLPALSAPTSDLFALGIGRKLMNFEERQAFQIQVFNGPLLVMSSPVLQFNIQLNKPDFFFYREHLRRLRLTLTKKSGAIPGWLLARRHFGTPCPVCCDEILNSPVSSECTVCYGTGILGGYYPPSPLMGEWSGDPPSNTNTVKDASGPSQVVKSQLRTFPFPDAATDDIWVDVSTGYRYVVQQQKQPNFKGVPMEQQMTVSRLPASHQAYAFPVPNQ